MSIGAISAHTSVLLQHAQNPLSSPTGKASRVQSSDADHDGDTDHGGVDNNDHTGKGQFINVKA